MSGSSNVIYRPGTSTTKGTSKGTSKGKKKDKTNVTCHWCGKTRHYANDCMARKAGLLKEHCKDNKKRKEAVKEYVKKEKSTVKVSALIEHNDNDNPPERVLDEYEQKEYLTWHIILTTVSPRLFATIKDKTLSTDMWITVKADATAKTELHQIDTRRQLHQKKCGESDNMKAHLEELINLRGKLIRMGMTVEDAEFCTIILSSLPLSH